MVSTSYDPLTIYRFIENTVLGQTEDQHPFATVYNQELGFYVFRQDNPSNPQLYERFNTKVDVGSNWRDPTTQGTPGVYGAGDIQSNLLRTYGGRTESHT